jgi:Uma2 family endonuclease
MSSKQDQTIPRRATYEDYLRIPDDGKRYEILDGAVFMMAAPSPRHQYASKRLQRVLEDYFEGARNGLVLNAPLDVVLADDDVVQPDLVVVMDRRQVSSRGIAGPPLVLVEVLSPSRPEYDRLTKAGRYAVRGVPHYWIVDPEGRAMECYRLVGDAYRLDAAAGGADVLAVPAFDGLTIALERLWLED